RRLVAANVDDAVDHEERIAVRQRREDALDVGCAEAVYAHSSSPALSRLFPPRAILPIMASALSHSRNGRAGKPPHCAPAGTSVMTPLRAPSRAPAPIVRWSAIPTWPPSIA